VRDFTFRKHLALEKDAKFYMFWVRRFIRQAPNPSLWLDDRIMAFADSLRAERAVRIYFRTFQRRSSDGRP
jgi:hypothetical protein